MIEIIEGLKCYFGDRVLNYIDLSHDYLVIDDWEPNYSSQQVRKLYPLVIYW